MKELAKILELLRALQQEKLEAGPCPLPCTCIPGESCISAANPEIEPAIQKHYTALSLWAIGHYNSSIAPIKVQQLVQALLLNLSDTAPCRRLNSELPSFEALRQQLQGFIDGWLDSNTEK